MRDPKQPQVPAVAEVIRQNFQMDVWRELLSGKNTPAGVQKILGKKIKAIIIEPDLIKFLEKIGADMNCGYSQKTEEITPWKKTTHLAGIFQKAQ